MHPSNWLSAVAEVTAAVLLTFFLMRLLSLGGKWFYRVIASLLVVISVAVAYYMVFFNVVIGYAIVASVMTTDIDLPSYGGVVARSYLPSNWIAVLGLFAWTKVDEKLDSQELLDPEKNFTYVATPGIDDTYCGVCYWRDHTLGSYGYAGL